MDEVHARDGFDAALGGGWVVEELTDEDGCIGETFGGGGRVGQLFRGV